MGSSDRFDLFADPSLDVDGAAAAAPTDAPSSVTECPRCHRSLDEAVDRFYGPCTECRAELRAKFLDCTAHVLPTAEADDLLATFDTLATTELMRSALARMASSLAEMLDAPSDSASIS